MSYPTLSWAHLLATLRHLQHLLQWCETLVPLAAHATPKTLTTVQEPQGEITTNHVAARATILGEMTNTAEGTTATTHVTAGIVITMTENHLAEWDGTVMIEMGKM